MPFKQAARVNKRTSPSRIRAPPSPKPSSSCTIQPDVPLYACLPKQPLPKTTERTRRFATVTGPNAVVLQIWQRGSSQVDDTDCDWKVGFVTTKDGFFVRGNTSPSWTADVAQMEKLFSHLRMLGIEVALFRRKQLNRKTMLEDCEPVEIDGFLSTDNLLTLRAVLAAHDSLFHMLPADVKTSLMTFIQLLRMASTISHPVLVARYT